MPDSPVTSSFRSSLSLGSVMNSVKNVGASVITTAQSTLTGHHAVPDLENPPLPPVFSPVVERSRNGNMMSPSIISSPGLNENNQSLTREQLLQLIMNLKKKMLGQEKKISMLKEGLGSCLGIISDIDPVIKEVTGVPLTSFFYRVPNKSETEALNSDQSNPDGTPSKAVSSTLSSVKSLLGPSEIIDPPYVGYALDPGSLHSALFSMVERESVRKRAHDREGDRVAIESVLVNELESKCATLEGELKFLRSSLESSESVAAARLAEVDAMEAAMGTLQRELQSSRKRAVELTNQTTDLEAKVTLLSSQLSASESRCSDLGHTQKEARALLLRAQEEADHARNALEDEREKNMDSLKEMQVLCENAEKAVADAVAAATAAQQERERTLAELSRAHARMETVEAHAERMAQLSIQKRSSEFQAEKESLQKKVAELQRSVDSLTSINEALEKKLYSTGLPSTPSNNNNTNNNNRNNVAPATGPYPSLSMNNGRVSDVPLNWNEGTDNSIVNTSLHDGSPSGSSSPQLHTVFAGLSAPPSPSTTPSNSNLTWAAGLRIGGAGVDGRGPPPEYFRNVLLQYLALVETGTVGSRVAGAQPINNHSNSSNSGGVTQDSYLGWVGSFLGYSSPAAGAVSAATASASSSLHRKTLLNVLATLLLLSDSERQTIGLPPSASTPGPKRRENSHSAITSPGGFVVPIAREGNNISRIL